jgi:hypothetical protein
VEVLVNTYTITKHATEEMQERGITEEVLDLVMQSPGQIVPERDELVAYQSVRAMLESGVREITADLRKVAHCC